MDRIRALIIAIVFGFMSASAASAGWSVGASVGVDTGLFYNDLSSYGTWVEVADYGWVWSPRVAVSWRPYTVGHWVWTDDNGWLWVSDEDYGWAVYHYGRWDLDPSYGWIWVPGYEWGPAWVSWRSGGGYIGWAPLTPRIGFQVGVGFGFGAAHFDNYIDPSYYSFVPQRSFLEGNVSRVVVPVGRNATIVTDTRNVTDYSVSGNRVVNRGLTVAQVQQLSGRSVPRLSTREVSTIGAAHQLRVHGDSVPVFRPNIRRADSKTPPNGRTLSGETLGKNQRNPYEGQRTTQGKSIERSQARGRVNENARTGRADVQQKTEKQQRSVQAQTEKQQRSADRAQQQQLARDRQAREQSRQQLEKRQAFERKDLERVHQQEIKKPPREVPANQLDQRHAQEHQALADRQVQQRQQLEARASRPQSQQRAQNVPQHQQPEARASQPQPQQHAQAPQQTRTASAPRQPAAHEASPKPQSKPKG